MIFHSHAELSRLSGGTVVTRWRDWLNKRAQQKFAAKMQPLNREMDLFWQFIGVCYAMVGLAEGII